MKKRICLLLLTLCLLVACAPAVPTETEPPTETSEPVSESIPESETESETLPESETESETLPESETESETEREAGSEEPIPKPLTVFPEIPVPTPAGWLSKTVENYENVPLQKLTPVSDSGFPAPLGWLNSDTDRYLSAVHNEKPIEHIFMTDEDHACVVFRLHREEHTDKQYLYQVFEREVHADGSVDGGLAEDWLVTSENYRLTRALSLEDFSGIQVEDSIREVLLLEPALLRFDTFPDKDYYYGVFPFLIEEGVLIMRFDPVTEDNPRPEIDNMIVSHMTFYPYGTEAEYRVKLSVLTAANRPVLPTEEERLDHT